MRYIVVLFTILFLISWNEAEALQIRPKRLAQDEPKEEPKPATDEGKEEPGKKGESKID